MKKPVITPAAIAALADGNTANFIAALTPGGIEAQEAAGQRDMVANTRLPKEIIHSTDVNPIVLASKGFEFLGDYDDLFYSVKLPAGWKLVPTDHSMWSDLVDDKGRVRANIFYKAAFYDRSAHMSFNPRFYVNSEYEGGSYAPDARKRYFVTDRLNPDNPPFRGEFFTRQRDNWGQDTEESNKVYAWLKTNYPDYEKSFAYWD